MWLCLSQQWDIRFGNTRVIPINISYNILFYIATTPSPASLTCKRVFLTSLGFEKILSIGCRITSTPGIGFRRAQNLPQLTLVFLYNTPIAHRCRFLFFSLVFQLFFLLLRVHSPSAIVITVVACSEKDTKQTGIKCNSS